MDVLGIVISKDLKCNLSYILRQILDSVMDTCLYWDVVTISLVVPRQELSFS